MLNSTILRLCIILSLSFAFIAKSQETSRVVFSGTKNNLIDWRDIKAEDWLNYDLWKVGRYLRDKEPEWKRNLAENTTNEKIGYVIECVGNCGIYRGEGKNSVQFRSTLKEGDELFTEEDSYLYAFMMNGTIIRVAPNTSITLREINVGKEQVFFHFRLNFGNFTWLPRSLSLYEVKDIRETDSIFIPLSFFNSNIFKEEKFYNENSKLIDYETIPLNIQKYNRLNALIDANNSFVSDKKSILFCVLPNGTVYTEDSNTELIHLKQAESYVKIRSDKELGIVDNRELLGSFFYRGFDKVDDFKLTKDVWYEVGIDGTNISEYEDSDKFNMSEYLVTRIPSILIAREMLLEEKSKFIFNKSFNYQKLGETHGYRLWEDINSSENDLYLRLKFLKEYTRRVETSNLIISKRFYRDLKERGEEVKPQEYTDAFYKRAIEEYIRKRETDVMISTGGRAKEYLNSTKKKFWKIINAKK